jgi:biotin-(acetyl-CoA carboxylase) ligase
MGRPKLVQEFTSGLCRPGRTWGYVPGRGIWVSNACSARFSNR